MDERVMQFRVGVFVLFALIVTAIVLVLFGKLPSLIPGRYYLLTIRCADAGGATEGTPIRKSGILIGRIIAVKLDDKELYVLMTAQIQDGVKVYKNELCYITRDLVGNTAVEFVHDPEKRGAGGVIERNETVEGKISDDPTGLKRALKEPIDTVRNTGNALKDASDQLGVAAKRVGDILNQDAQRNVHDILRDSAKSLKTIQKMLGDEENQTKLAEAIQRLPKTLDNMNSTFQATEETLQTLTKRSTLDGRTPIERLVDTIEMTEKTLRQFNESTDPNKPPPAEQVAQAIENVDEITRLMRTFMTNLDQGKGSLGALVNDRQLYDRLNRAARNIERISQDLKPIVNDARVFSDKVSRHPGLIIRDAVKPGAGLK